MNRIQWDRWNQWKMKLCSKKWSKVRIIIMLYKFILTSDAEPYILAEDIRGQKVDKNLLDILVSSISEFT